MENHIHKNSKKIEQLELKCFEKLLIIQCLEKEIHILNERAKFFSGSLFVSLEQFYISKRNELIILKDKLYNSL